jgi:hypothetical protein
VRPWWVPVVYATTLLPFLLCLVRYWWQSRNTGSRQRAAFLTLYAAMVAVLGYATLATAVDLPQTLRLVLMPIFVGGVQLAGWLQYRAIVRASAADAAPCPHRRSTHD